MRFLAHSVAALVALGASSVSAASGWGFSDATVTVQSKGSGVGGGAKEK
jgi:oligosaccharyltransferase complex subunit delta (ribophorin II)